MNDDVEKKKNVIKENLEELYVDRYDTFKESVLLLNSALDNFNINYQYSYDIFCRDFTYECLRHQELHPRSNWNDPNEIMYNVLPIVMRIIENAKNKYGFIDDYLRIKLNNKNDEEETEKK